MNFKVAALIGCALLNFTFGLFVYLKNRKSLINLFYTVFMLFVALWSFGLAMFYLIAAEPKSIFWSNFLYFMGSSIAVAFFYSSLVFPSGKALPARKIALPVGLLFLLFFLYFFTPTMVRGIIYPNGVKTFVYGKFHLLFDIHFSLLFALAFWKLYQDTRRLVGQKREQAKYLLLSTFIGVTFNGVTNVSMPSLFHNCSLIWIGPYITVVMVAITTYAIVKYDLMGIETAGKYLLSRTLSLVSVGIIVFLASSFFQKLVTQKEIAIFFTGTLGGILIFYPLYRKIEQSVGRRLGVKADYQHVLKNYTDTEITVAYNVKQLSDSMMKTLSDTLKMENCSLMLLDKDKKQYYISSSSGLREPTPELGLPGNSPLVSLLKRKDSPNIIIKDGLDKILSSEETRLVTKDLERVKAAISLPLFMKNELIGILNLGNKISGEIYNHEEITFVLSVGKLSAVIIQLLEAIETYQAKLIYAEKMAGIDEMLGSTNHELNNLISGIRSAAQILNQQQGLSPEDRTQMMQQVLTYTARASAVTSWVNDYRRKLDYTQPIEVEIKKAIDEAIPAIKEQLLLTLDKIQIVKDIPQDLPRLQGKVTLPDLFFHLLTNSCYSMEKNGGQLKISIKKLTSDYIEIKITDTGGDIAQRMQMGPEFGGRWFTERTQLGGLNLFLARHIVTDHQGTFEDPKSNQGKGAIFIVRVPIKQPKTKEAL